MEDSKIIELFFNRDEKAVSETAAKYSAYCMKIAMNILENYSDSEECVNDSYLCLWKNIPPQRPVSLSAFIGKITRNLALNRYKARHTLKRAGGELTLSLDELDDCLSDGADAFQAVTQEALSESINAFLKAQPEQLRRVFVCRYFYCDSLSDIAKRMGFSESKVKSLLFRARKKLKIHLESEGIKL